MNRSVILDIGGDFGLSGGESTPQWASSSAVLDSFKLIVGKLANEVPAAQINTTERETVRVGLEGATELTQRERGNRTKERVNRRYDPTLMEK